MIKIFSSDKLICLTNNRIDFKPKENSILTKIESSEEMKLVYYELIGKNNLDEIYFYNESLEKLFSYFSSMFKVIEAAGGLVKNKKNELLFIFRNGKWDLPKGKIEKEETINKAAIREVEEECGIKKLKIIKQLITTYHTYSIKEKEILKPTYWFEMSSNDENKLVPQLEEGITEVRWVKNSELMTIKGNTFPSILEVISAI